ncbi:MAG: hypothetical protein KIH62_003705 [Candidatus Kerfeldbacteria bacterium]|nr:hypothetical protein [Candidatus Kerfeldbacteria bacterium]
MTERRNTRSPEIARSLDWDWAKGRTRGIESGAESDYTAGGRQRFDRSTGRLLQEQVVEHKNRLTPELRNAIRQAIRTNDAAALADVRNRVFEAFGWDPNDTKLKSRAALVDAIIGSIRDAIEKKQLLLEQQTSPKKSE